MVLEQVYLPPPKARASAEGTRGLARKIKTTCQALSYPLISFSESLEQVFSFAPLAGHALFLYVTETTEPAAHLVDDHLVRAGHHQRGAGVRPRGRLPRDAHHIAVSSSSWAALALVQQRALQHHISLQVCLLPAACYPQPPLESMRLLRLLAKIPPLQWL